MENYFKGSRICKYCGINMDIKDLDMLYFFHDTCWQEYRKNGEVYPMPSRQKIYPIYNRNYQYR